jgi:RND family efflux transporter MFP subunit
MKISLLFTLTACVTFTLLACSKKEAETKASNVSDAQIAVVAEKLTLRSFQEWVSYPADLRGSEDAVLTAGAGGRVLSVADVGAIVTAGDALCDIESARYAAVLEQVQASIDLTKSELERTEANVKAGSLGKAALDKAKLDYQGTIVNQFQAKRVFEDSRCQAPFDGVVVSRSIEQFQTVAPGTPTVRIARTDRLEAWISLPEADVSSYAKGGAVRFLVPGTKTDEFTGFLKSVDLAVDTKTRTALGRLTIINRKNQLGPGMAGKALLLRKSYANAIVIPTTSILRNESGPFVMIAENGVARKHELTLGPSVGDSVVVTSGLSAGDVLITVGSFRASEGTKVKF